MKIRFERPSGHVVTRLECPLEKVAEHHAALLKRVGGYLEAIDESDNLPVMAGGTVEPRRFVHEYVMARGGSFAVGTICQVQAKTATDVHVNIKTGPETWELFTLPRRDFYAATKPENGELFLNETAHDPKATADWRTPKPAGRRPHTPGF